MTHRLLGRTGVRVSPLCLGTLNFGGPTPDDEAVRIVDAALDAGVNFIDTADMYHGGAIRGGRRQGAGRPPPPRRAGDEGPLPHGRRAERRGELAPAHPARLRGVAAPPEHRLHRPLPDSSSESRDSGRGDAGGAHRPRQSGKGAVHRLLDAPGVDGHGGAGGERAARARPLRQRTAALQPARPAHRERAAADGHAPRPGDPAVGAACAGAAGGTISGRRRAAGRLESRAPAGQHLLAEGHTSRNRSRPGVCRPRRANTVCRPGSWRCSGARTSRG